MRILIALLVGFPALAYAQVAPEGPAAPPAEGPSPPPAAPEAGPPGEAELAPAEEEVPGHEGEVGSPIDYAEAGVGLDAGLHLRKGFFGGGTFGAGGLTADCGGCADYDAIGFSLDAGWAVNETWGLVAEILFTGGVGSETIDGKDVAGQIFEFGVAARYWPVDRLWVQAGLGIGAFSRIREGSSDPLRQASGAGLILGAGLELWRSPSRHVVVDLRARLGFFSLEQSEGEGSDESYDATQKAVLVGVSWY